MSPSSVTRSGRSPAAPRPLAGALLTPRGLGRGRFPPFLNRLDSFLELREQRAGLRALRGGREPDERAALLLGLRDVDQHVGSFCRVACRASYTPSKNSSSRRICGTASMS